MSADNWAVCPQCKRNEQAKRDELEKKFKSAYGKVSEGEYLDMKAEFESTPRRVDAQNLREDYEIYMDKDGTFVVSYSCSCDECGFGYKYEYSEDVLK